MKVATLLAVASIAIGCDSSSEKGSGFNGAGGSAGTSGIGGAGGASDAVAGGAGGVAGVASMTSGGAGGMSSIAGTGGASGVSGAAGTSAMAGAGGTAGATSGGAGGAGGEGGGGEGGGAALACPDGCTAMASACFCPPMVVDWNGAQSICMGAGLGLATIRDRASNDAIAAVIAAQGLSGQDSSLYIGLEDHATEGTFGWVSGEPLELTNWAPEQPNNSFIQAGPEGEDCGVIQADGGWWDFPCNLLTAGFICN